MAFDSRWGALLRQARRNAKLTQETVARTIGVNAIQVSRWERGLVNPKDVYRVRLAKLLGVTTGDLFPYDDDNGDAEQAAS